MGRFPALEPGTSGDRVVRDTMVVWAESWGSVGPLSDCACPPCARCATIRRRRLMAKRTSRLAWGLAVVQGTVLLIGGSVFVIRLRPYWIALHHGEFATTLALASPKASTH